MGYIINKESLTRATNILGNTLGLASTGIMVVATHAFINKGGIRLYEPNKTIAVLEFLAAMFGVGFFLYKVGRGFRPKKLGKGYHIVTRQHRGK